MSKYEPENYLPLILVFAYNGHGVSIGGHTCAVTIEADNKAGKFDLIKMLKSSVIGFANTITFALLDCCRDKT